MVNKKDYYQILGVSKEASSEEIKKAYKKLALKYHPDRYAKKTASEKKLAEEKFKEINEAHRVLSDPKEKEKYDHWGNFDFRGFQNGQGFENTSSIFKDIFDTFFGSDYSPRNQNSNKKQPQKGEDLLLRFNLSFKESVLGTSQEVILELNKACSSCQQTGAYSKEHLSNCSTCKGKGVIQTVQRTFFRENIYAQISCPNCQGTGEIISKKCSFCLGKKFTKQKEKISLTIPRGIQSKQLRMRNAGNDGWYGAEKGDIYLEIEVKKHRYFQRKGNDIHVELPISFLDAILGNYVEVITLEGLEKIQVPIGTQNNDYYLIKNRGCYLGIDSSFRGDFHVHFQVVIPKKIGGETREILKRIPQENWNPNQNFIKNNQDILKE